MNKFLSFINLFLLSAGLIVLASLFCVIFIISIISTAINLVVSCISDLVGTALGCVVFFITYALMLSDKMMQNIKQQGDEE